MELTYTVHVILILEILMVFMYTILVTASS